MSTKAIVIGTWFLTAAACALVACWWLLISGIASGPVSPDAISGHVVPYNNHGTIQYITNTQHNLLWELPVAFVAVVALGMWLRKQRERNEG